MTFTAVGSLQNGENTVSGLSTTFSLTTTTTGDFVMVEICTNNHPATAVSSTKCTWTQAGTTVGPLTLGGTGTFYNNVWVGTVNSTGSDTVTVSFGTNPAGNCRFDAREFHASSGHVYFDVQGTLNSAGTANWPTLTPAHSNELYWGWCEDSGSAVAGSTSGFVYEIDSNSNASGYNLSVSSAFTPVWGDSGMVAGLMVLMTETPPAGGPSDFPQVQPGPTWFDLFKPQWPKSRVPAPPPGPPAAGATGSFALAPLALSGTGAQTSPDLPQVQPGPAWLDVFKPGLLRPRPPVPPTGPPAVSAAGAFSLAPLALTGTGAQTSPDAPQVAPGPWWIRLFRPDLFKPAPPLPSVQSVSAAGSLALAPLALSGAGALTAPDQPQVQPGPAWLRFFKPWVQRPVPPVAATPVVTASGSLALAPPAFSGQAGQTGTDQPQASPGPFWFRLFKPGMPRPAPPVPAVQAVSASGSLSLAPLALSGAGAQGSPDVPQVQPGPSWLRWFKPGLWKPVPPVPATPSVSGTGSFTLAPLSFSAQAAQTSPDVTQVQPGPFWLRLFRPQAPKPLPPAPAVQAVSATGALALAPLAFSAAGGQTSPDLPAAEPGYSWLRFFKPQWPKPRPLPLVPPPSGIQATGSLALAPLAFSAQGTQTSPDFPAVQPGPAWFRLFKPWVQRPVPPLPAPGPVTGTGSFSLAPLALSGQAAQTSPDVPQAQPGPVWSRLFRPWQPRPVPPLPAAPSVSTSGSLPLAPLAFAGQGAQSSPDVPAVQPGPFWLRLFRPWVQRPVPPPPATPAVSASGSFSLAPLGLSGTGGVTGAGIRDLPQILPGPLWLRLYKPWIPRPFPVNAGQGSVAVPATGPSVVFTYGEPYFEWAYGTPYFEWEYGDPHFEWETGTPYTS